MSNTRLLYILLFLCACTKSVYMTENNYKEVTIGENISKLQPLIGVPYEIKKLSENKQHYIYIERISIGDNRELFRKYILVVENAIVIDKYVIEETTPPVQFFGS